MKIRAVIVDDEPKAREVLRHFLSRHSEIKVVGEGATGQEAIRLAAELEPDVLFLDVRMPEMDGMSAARVIAKNPEPPSLIFTTAFEEHAVGAFELEAMDYLVKPYTAQRITAAVERLIQRKQAAARSDEIIQGFVKKLRLGVPRRLSFEVLNMDGERSSVFVNEDMILFAEARGRHTRIVTTQAELETTANIGEVEQWLDNRLFFKSHRSYLVNLAKIAELKTTGRSFGLFLEGGKKYGLIPLSRGRVEELKLQLSQTGK